MIIFKLLTFVLPMTIIIFGINKIINKKQSPDKGKQHDSRTNKKSY